jgi:hypothetical protein
MDEGAFVAQLERMGSKVKGKLAQCPFHDDRTPSAQWSQGNDGTWRIFCHVCNKHANLYDLREHQTGRAARQQFADAIPKDDRKTAANTPRKQNDNAPLMLLPTSRDCAAYAKRIGEPVAWYKYGPADAPVLVVCRIIKDGGKKSFLQFSRHGDGWTPKCTLADGKIPLYGAHALPDTGPVLVVEGEKCVDACRDEGVAAVSSAMGAGKAGKSDWSCLAGRDVVLWPDHDPIDPKSGKSTGREHMADVAALLEGVAASVRLIDPAPYGLPPKGDVADLIESHSRELRVSVTIQGIMEAADHIGGSAPLADKLEAIISGAYSQPPSPWRSLDNITKWLYPSTVVLLCADPGAGKSMMLMQLMGHCVENGIPAATYMLEDGPELHLQRAFVQVARDPNLFDLEWIKGNPDKARRAYQAHRPTLDKISRSIMAEGDKEITREDLIAWAERKAKGGARIITFDPITATKTADKPWAEDAAFITNCKRIAKTYGATVIISTHPRGTNKAPSLASMAGGMAFSRFCHTAIWLCRHDPTESVTVGSPQRHERTIEVLKARNGTGANLNIAVTMERHCTITDLGPIIETASTERKHSAGTKATQDEARGRSPRLKSAPNESEEVF